MSPQEILHRTRFHFKRSRWRRLVETGWTPAAHPSDVESVSFWPPPLDPSEPEWTDLMQEAEGYLQHRWYFFGLQNVQEVEIDWHRDPSTGIVAPSTRFGFDIDHRNEDLVGNIKMTWEKSRHHHLTVLAAAYHHSKDERFAREVTSQIADWIQHNPFLLGVHWTHPLEQAIRLIAWVWCERLLRGSEAYDALFVKNQGFWDSVFQHQWFIEQTYSRGSSANNHLIGEMAGLYVAASAWPQFDASERWRHLAKGFLEREIQRQTFPSGLNREQAFSYHLFTTEFFLLSMAEAKQYDDAFSEDFIDRLVAMVNVLSQVTDCGGNLPRYGDGDEGRAIQWQALGAPRDLWLRTFGNDLLASELTERPAEPTGSTLVKGAGLCVMRSTTAAGKEVFLLADAGPHGFLSIAAHAHADALSFVLSVEGIPILIDPGTYVYHTDEHWRDYFRSTHAHNTVIIDGEDQSAVGGAFLWTRQAKTRIHEFSCTRDGAVLEASHNGFSGAGVECKRRITLAGPRVVVEDRLVGTGEHTVEIRFHTHPDCCVEVTSENKVKIERKGIILDLTPPANLSIRLARGEPSAGWYAPRFGVKQETTTVILSKARAPLTPCTTQIEISP